MPNAEPLLLLHGVGMSGSTWKGVADLLDDSFDVLTPTAAGHRGGPELGEISTVLELVDATERYLDDLGLHRVHISGNSLGGWMAIELARRGRATSVCALSPSGFWTIGERDETDATSQVRGLRSLALSTRFVASPVLRFPLGRRLTMAKIARHAENLTHREAVDALADLVDCPAADALLPATEEIAPMAELPCPIMLAWAEHDRLLPLDVNGSIARHRLPDATFRVLNGVGHVPMIDDAVLCADTIRASTMAI